MIPNGLVEGMSNSSQEEKNLAGYLVCNKKQMCKCINRCYIEAQ